MRIIGGKFKGRRIDMPKGVEIRPTPDKVREALFNIIKDNVSNAAVLDLFAGSGSLGIEAISRGAGSVTFVDIQKRCINTISSNLEKMPLTAKMAKLIQGDAIKSIKKLNDLKISFDIIFLDPPYYSDWIKKCLINLGNYDILNNSSLVICEHFKRDAVPEEMARVKRIRQSRYGDTVVSFYKKSS